jgi:hypothetical protein
MPDYDIVEAFERIEKELMESMIRNLDHHRAMETDEGFEWSQWQVEQLKALENYKKKNKKKYGTQFKDINKQLGALIYLARSQGNMEQEIKILEAIKKGFTDYHKPSKKTAAIDAAFFRVNDKKIDALIEATTKDFEKAEYAMLRRANDQYRKVIYNAQVYANAGGTTYEKAVDMAVQDYLKAGINCIEYSNGSRHTMKDYADMCIRTTTKRAYLTGEGEKRKEWGISLVIMNKRGNPCPKCLPFVGKIMVDDVWSGGKPDGKHMLMSTAIAAGLYHPRCKDSHTTYFEGINTKGAPYTKEEKRQVIEDYNQEQKANQAKRQAEQQQRMADMMLNKKDKQKHQRQADLWEEKEKNYSKQSIEQCNERVTSAICKNYEYRRMEKGLHLTPLEEIVETSSAPRVNLNGMDKTMAQSTAEQLEKLTKEYETMLQSVEIAKFPPELDSVLAMTEPNLSIQSASMTFNYKNVKNRDKFMERMGKAVKRRQYPSINSEDYDKYATTHEFAHSMLDMHSKTKNFVNADTLRIKTAREEMQKIRSGYIEELAKAEKEWKSAETKALETFNEKDWEIAKQAKERYDSLFISKYADTSDDEFIAEAFTEAKLGNNPSEYSKKVEAVFDKYFKKQPSSNKYIEWENTDAYHKTLKDDGREDFGDFNIPSIKKSLDENKRMLHDLKNDFSPVTLAQLPTEHKWNVKDIIKNAPNDVKKIIDEYYDDINIISFNPYKGKAHYSRKDKAIRIDIEKAAKDERGAYTPLFHEIGHNIDHLLGNISHTRNFGEILRKDFNDVVKEYMKVYNCDIDTAYRDIGKMTNGNKYHSISDILSGIIDHKYLPGYRHEAEYWENQYKLEHEAFAHFFEAYVRNDTIMIKNLTQMFPRAIEVFLEMLKEV